MRCFNLLSLAVGLCLWEQVVVDQSQIWLGFALIWTTLLGSWVVLRSIAVD